MMHKSFSVAVLFFGCVFFSACATSNTLVQRQESTPITIAEPQQEVAVPSVVTPSICIKEQCFGVEIADDGLERMNGLMWRESMDQKKGMWFVFDEPAGHMAFWMKNTLIPLDMIWVDQDMRIVSLAHNVQPCKVQECPSYDPGATPARYVLEVNGGLARKYDFATGDLVLFQE